MKLHLILIMLMAQSCFGQTQPDLNKIGSESLSKATKNLQEGYQRISEQFRGDILDKLSTSQKYWIDYRDKSAEIDSLVIAEGGTMAKSTKDAATAQAIENRILELNHLKDSKENEHKSLADADRELNVVYKKFSSLLSEEIRSKLVGAEKAWILYRDAQATLEGSIRSGDENVRKKVFEEVSCNITLRRTESLRGLLNILAN